jgi:hypothetical protein
VTFSLNRKYIFFILNILYYDIYLFTFLYLDNDILVLDYDLE